VEMFKLCSRALRHVTRSRAVVFIRRINKQANITHVVVVVNNQEDAPIAFVLFLEHFCRSVVQELSRCSDKRILKICLPV